MVFWGSQSGRAEILARQFARTLQHTYNLRTLAADLNDFSVATLSSLTPSQPCAFFLSTYGDGDPPDNVCALWSFLHSNDSKELFANLRYTIFGLGNSNYRLYNQVAKTADTLIQKLGGAPLVPMGMGNDAEGNTENGFAAWTKDALPTLKINFNWKEQVQKYQPSFAITEDMSLASNVIHHGAPLLNQPQTKAVVKESRVLWQDAERMCLHVELELGADRQLKYKTGDHLLLRPCNTNHDVENLLQILGLWEKKETCVTIKQVSEVGQGKVQLPSPTTYEAFFRHYLQISGPLSMHLVEALAEFAPSEAVRHSLIRLSQNAEEFKATVKVPQLTLAGLVRSHSDDHDQWNIPLSFLVERFKPLQPRPYSISSSAVCTPKVASLTVVVDKHSASNGTESTYSSDTCKGLATGYLCAVNRSSNGESSTSSFPQYALNYSDDLQRGYQIFSHVQPTSFKLPIKSSAPVIMVGAGTGVAPFRAFVQERLQRGVRETIGRTLLFMGFRHKEVDYIYQDEWENARTTLGENVFSYWTAFSRDSKSGADKKVYVQNLIEEHQAEVLDLLAIPGCRFYICGSNGMARGVVDSLAIIRSKRTGCSKDEALEWIKQLRQFNTLMEELWG